MDYSTFSKLSYGVYVIGNGVRGEQNAFVATTAFQVTAEPPKIAVACNKNNFSAGLIEKHGAFSVSALKQDFRPAVLGNFGFQSGKTADKFVNANVIYGEKTGVPIVLDDCAAWFECKLVDKIDVGTHLLYVGEVVEMQMVDAAATPLTYAYYHDVKRGATPENAPHSTAKTTNQNNNQQKKNIMTYVCTICGYVYDPTIGDPDGGIAPGTPFEQIPDGWRCPICGVSKADFVAQG